MEDWRQRRPRRTAEVEIEEAADGLLVYQPGEDRVHYLNHTAALLLELCDGSATGGEIATTVAHLYSLDRVPLADVEETLERLGEEGLIRWAPADEPG